MDEPEVPAAGEHLWETFTKLIKTRQVGMYANPISYTEIYAYCSLTGIVLNDSEVSILLEMDSVFLSTKPDE